jgi:GDPmannose 4,6-dehydratase
MKIAFITGITGQDGSYLTEFLLAKEYKVHGLVRRTSNHQNTTRLHDILTHPNLQLHTGDITDASAIQNILTSIWSSSQETDILEIYNLAAQSHVHQSFKMPDYTAKADGLGPLYILEWMRVQKNHSRIRFYQASTSELFGKVQTMPQTETTPFYPRSPYAVAKLYAYWIVKNYRESYDLFAVNGILFNHESPRRGEDFVTRKVTLGLANYLHGTRTVLEIGNLDAKRDWGHARDFVEGMWQMLQVQEPEDFVLSTGVQHSVREFIEIAYEYSTGHMIRWEGEGVEERGIDSLTNELVVKVNPEFFRPAEVSTLLGDATKAHECLDWQPRTSFEDLVKEMMKSDLKGILHIS